MKNVNRPGLDGDDAPASEIDDSAIDAELGLQRPTPGAIAIGEKNKNIVEEAKNSHQFEEVKLPSIASAQKNDNAAVVDSEAYAK
jgi:hypothetical protein